MTNRLSPTEARLFAAAGAVEDPAAAAAVFAATKADNDAIIASAFDVPTAAKRLGKTPARIRQRLRERTLYGFKVGGVWCIPRFQFVGARATRLVPGIDKVIPHIPDDAIPLAVVRLLTLPQCDLEADDDGPDQTPVGRVVPSNPSSTWWARSEQHCPAKLQGAGATRSSNLIRMRRRSWPGSC